MKQVVRLAAAVVFAAATLSGCVQSPRNLTSAQSPFSVEIRRTQDGIPHIKADDWASLGYSYGYGYVQAQDNLCTLADGFSSRFAVNARRTLVPTRVRHQRLLSDSRAISRPTSSFVLSTTRMLSSITGPLSPRPFAS